MTEQKMKHLEEEPPERDCPHLDVTQWGDDDIVLHEGTSEGAWVKSTEDSFVEVRQ